MRTYYKVVTKGMRSLGLRKNPTILKFTVNKWVSSPTVKEGKSDDGGIWVAQNLSGANKLKKYMDEQYGIKTLIFLCLADKILYSNSYRVKTNRVMLLK